MMLELREGVGLLCSLSERDLQHRYVRVRDVSVELNQESMAMGPIRRGPSSQILSLLFNQGFSLHPWLGKDSKLSCRL